MIDPPDKASLPLLSSLLLSSLLNGVIGRCRRDLKLRDRKIPDAQGIVARVFPKPEKVNVEPVIRSRSSGPRSLAASSLSWPGTLPGSAALPRPSTCESPIGQGQPRPQDGPPCPLVRRPADHRRRRPGSRLAASPRIRFAVQRAETGRDVSGRVGFDVQCDDILRGTPQRGRQLVRKRTERIAQAAELLTQPKSNSSVSIQNRDARAGPRRRPLNDLRSQRSLTPRNGAFQRRRA